MDVKWKQSLQGHGSWDVAVICKRLEPLRFLSWLIWQCLNWSTIAKMSKIATVFFCRRIFDEQWQSTLTYLTITSRVLWLLLNRSHLARWMLSMWNSSIRKYWVSISSNLIKLWYTVREWTVNSESCAGMADSAINKTVNTSQLNSFTFHDTGMEAEISEIYISKHWQIQPNCLHGKTALERSVFWLNWAFNIRATHGQPASPKNTVNALMF